MKKILNLILCSLMMFGIVGCTHDDRGETAQVIGTKENIEKQQDKEKEIEWGEFTDLFEYTQIMNEQSEKYLNKEVNLKGILTKTEGVYQLTNYEQLLGLVPLYVGDSNLSKYLGCTMYVKGYLDEYNSFTVTDYEVKNSPMAVSDLPSDRRSLNNQYILISGYITTQGNDYVLSEEIFNTGADILIKNGYDYTGIFSAGDNKATVLGVVVVEGAKTYIEIIDIFVFGL